MLPKQTKRTETGVVVEGRSVGGVMGVIGVGGEVVDGVERVVGAMVVVYIDRRVVQC